MKLTTCLFSLIKTLSRWCWKICKWGGSPLWGPIWIVGYVAEVSWAFLWGRKSRFDHTKRSQEKEAREQAKEKWRREIPRLKKWMGLAFLFHIGKPALLKLTRGTFILFFIARFILRRLHEAKNYVQERRDDKCQAAENRRQAALDEKLETERKARQKAEEDEKIATGAVQYENLLRALRDF